MDANDSHRPAAPCEQEQPNINSTTSISRGTGEHDPLLSSMTSLNGTKSIGTGYVPSYGEYPSSKDQRKANFCLIGAAMLSCISYKIHARWIQFCVVLNQLYTTGNPANL